MPKIEENINSVKRYLTQNSYLRNKFGKKVIKLSLNAGMNCPNRDGTKGTGGCTYCSASLSGDFSGNRSDTITEQLTAQKELLSHKWHDCLYIPYFQAGSNTYAPVNILRPMFDEALSFNDCVGISIATRADCITNDMAEYLCYLDSTTYLTVELGLQTVFDNTAVKINRCHTYEEFLTTYNFLHNKGINVCVHIINGLPGETRDMMIETAARVSALRPHSIKIHMLHIINGTQLAEEYNRHPFNILGLQEYINIVCDQIEIMHPDTIIERVTGDGNKNTLIAPLWTANKKSVMNGIDKELIRRNSYQGKHTQRAAF